MANFGLIFKQRVKFGVNASAELLPAGAVQLDASVDEQHVSRNEVTQYPVETGINISDHIRRQPDTLVITGVVTDQPITAGGAGRGDRSLEAHQATLKLLDDAQLITVVTTLRQYENMVLESVETPRSAALGNSVQMTLSFREVLTAEVAEVTGTTELGTQNTTVVD